jgi:hypothetical protein
MKRTWATLQQLSRDELVAEYDREAATVGTWGISFIRAEIFQRDLEAQGTRMEGMTREMARLTNQIKWLTVAIGVMTLISTVLVGISLGGE